MDQYLMITKLLPSYHLFNEDLIKHKDILNSFQTKLNLISPFNCSIYKIGELGNLLKCFYEIYNDQNYNESFLYSFGFHGYLDNLNGLKINIKNKKINFVKINKKQTLFTGSYYPTLIDEKPIKNTYHLNKSIILTGPNASGKTTLLKTTIINIILSQQFGCGCFKKATINPFKYLHCYLNIPDTMSRDSLFQAEARRCKEIIDFINLNKNERHFCVFDELYSGTNPEDALSSATAYMDYIVKIPKVTCMLTTHYINLCKYLSNNINVSNFHMKTICNNNSIVYTYILEKGISEIKGGNKVLKDLNYPKEIINNSFFYENKNMNLN